MLISKINCRLLAIEKIDSEYIMYTNYNYCSIAQVHNVESCWVNLLLKMADHDVPTTEALPSQNRMTQIREMLSTAVRMRRTDSSGDLMPNVSSACCFRH